MRLRIPVILMMLLSLGLLGGCKDSSPPLAMPPAKVTIRGTTWNVELAIDEQTRRRGLSNRMDLPSGRGMLFVFEEPRELSFWMRDCYISLDVAFIAPDLRVVNTYTMYAERDRAGRQHYFSAGPALYALEVPAGALAAAGVKAGDAVTFSPDIPLVAKAASRP